MQEYSSPAVVTLPDDATLVDAVGENAREHPGSVLFSRRRSGPWEPVTARDFAAEVQALAAGLVAAGVAPGDRVALLSRTRYEWTLTDYAIWTAGAATVPLYETSSAEQVMWILADSGAVLAVVENEGHTAVVEGCRERLPDLREVVTIEAGGLSSLAGRGTAEAAAELPRRRAAMSADSLATVIYTSGTTGTPKGCELTHRNLLFDVHTAQVNLGELFHEGAATVLFLPLAHVFARTVQCGAMLTRTRLGHVADTKHLVDDLAEFQPTFLLAVPYVFQKLHAGVRHAAETSGRGAVFARAERVAVDYSRALDRGGAPLRLRAAHALFDRLVYRRIRGSLGGRITWAISGGAPLGAQEGHFFRGVGIPVLEGYGLTETTGAATVNLPGRQRVGSIGPPLQGTDLRIADDGEILVRGPHLFRGYWRDPQRTAEAFTADGFLRTGDTGSIDDDGFVTVTGRKKELIVTAGGKNVAPAVLEDRLCASPLVSQAMVVGEARPYIAALLTLDADALALWAGRRGKPSGAAPALVGDADLLADLQAAVDHANTAVSQAEAIRRFRVLPVDFTQERGHLTPTLKVRRAAVLRDFADDVDRLYAPGSDPGAPTRPPAAV